MMTAPAVDAAPPAPATGGTALALDVHHGRDGCEVVLSGELDVATGPLLAMVGDHLATSGVRHVVLDLRAVRFCDVRGLAAVRHVAAGLRRRGGTLTLRRPTARVAGLLRLLGLAPMLTAPPPTPAPVPAGGGPIAGLGALVPLPPPTAAR